MKINLQSLKRRWVLLAIIIFGFLIRIYAISSTPPSLNWDEVSHGFNAYSILNTGKDEWGVSWPIIFRAYGDYKLPVYVYLTAISEIFFGLTTLAVRLPSVIAGTLTILFTYFLALHLLKNKTLSIYAALIAAVSPWGLFLSRAALEANVALVLVVSGAYLFLLGVDGKRIFLPLSVLLLGLSVWTYNSARIFVPLLLFSLLFVFKDKLIQVIKQEKKIVIISLLIATLFFIPMFFQLLNPVGQARYENVQLLDHGAIGRINELRQGYSLPLVVERAIFNKATYFTFAFTVNYVKHFSSAFLFFEGGDHYQFNIPGMGLLFGINIPFFIYGLVVLLKSLRTSKDLKILFLLLVFSPIAASLTRESPHVLRSIFMMIPLFLISAYGFVELEKKFKAKYWLSVVYLFLTFLSFAHYFYVYNTEYRTKYSWSWQYGYEEAVGFIRDNYDSYERIVFTKKYGEPHEFILFYYPWEPEKYLNDKNMIRFSQSNWFWVDRFDKFYFVNDWQIPKEGSEFELESGATFHCASCLLVTSPGNAPSGWRKMKEIYFLDGSKAFEIYEH